jgi:oxygen-independent coproporphyrinogen-3 oxidase
MVDVSLYFHVPFCEKKCPYCHFYVIPDKISHKNLLSTSFDLEWKQESFKLKNKRIVSIYFGGGTPTLFAPDGILKILTFIKEHQTIDECEITIEANPENVDENLLYQLREMGINRLSLGVQSLDDRSLETLERTHSAKKAKEAIFCAKKCGFKNISIDLMYDLPSQTVASFRYTLDQLQDLPIQHLSLYNLTIEPHTAFYKRRKSLTFVSPEISLQFLQMALTTLDNIGLKRYEISAFSKQGFSSYHNLGYWTARPFLGFGPSAFSYWEEERYRNVANLNKYAQALEEGESPVDFKEKLEFLDHVNELLAVHLRLVEGVDVNRFGKPSDETMRSIQKLVEEGFLTEETCQIRLSEKGMLFYDEVASRII